LRDLGGGEHRKGGARKGEKFNSEMYLAGGIFGTCPKESRGTAKKETWGVGTKGVGGDQRKRGEKKEIRQTERGAKGWEKTSRGAGFLGKSLKGPCLLVPDKAQNQGFR